MARPRSSSTLGSPLQQVAMGLVIVFLSPQFPPRPSPVWATYDALPDPLGWALVLSGTIALTRAEPAFATSRWLAGFAGLVSVPLWFPQLNHRLDDPGHWYALLPTVAFCIWLAREIAIQSNRQDPRDDFVAKRFGLLVWGFAAVAVLPVLAFGGGFDQLATATVLVTAIVYFAFVYYLFRVHRREWLGGPGPLEVRLDDLRPE